MQQDEAARAPNRLPAAEKLLNAQKRRRLGFRMCKGRTGLRLADHVPEATSCSRYRIKENFRCLPPSSRLSVSVPIGELSRRTGVNIETIRYYERIKMLPRPARTSSGRRIYGPAETRILAFIRRARELGFTLDEIRTLLAPSAKNGEGACAEVSELASGHLAEIRAKIADLKAMERVLAAAVRHCREGKASGCPLIDALWRSAA